MTKRNGNGKGACPICGRQLWGGGGAKLHVAACAKRPPPDELRRRLEAGETGASIARSVGVSPDTVRAWLKEDGLASPGATWSSADQMQIFPGYAPKFGKRLLRCETCNALPICDVTVYELGWVLCEALDKRQKEAMEKSGVDPLQLTTELWTRMPEVWR